MSKDKIFKSAFLRPSGFNFNKDVARVFDNMLERSVPLYREMHRMTVELTINIAKRNTNIYDLGCSTGTLLILLSKAIKDRSIGLFGVDNSLPMLKKCAENLKKSGVAARCSLIEQDFSRGVNISDASVAVMILTLQFIRPLERSAILRNIYKGLNNKGGLILIEKVLNRDSFLNSLYIELYHRFKENNGYSRLEIAKKREALENVLIPYNADENTALLKKSGFRSVERFFLWYNFCGFIALK